MVVEVMFCLVGVRINIAKFTSPSAQISYKIKHGFPPRIFPFPSSSISIPSTHSKNGLTEGIIMEKEKILQYISTNAVTLRSNQLTF